MSQAQGQTITTYAGTGVSGNSGDGGPATSALLSTPKNVAIDGAGNKYIVSGNVIRRVTPAGVISTFAGMGATGFAGDGGPATLALLNGPTGVTVGPSGNIYIADRFNNRVRMVNTSGIISTVAGNGTYASSGDGGTATAASIAWPANVAFDGSGNMYIAEQAGERVRKVTIFGAISTVAGSGCVGCGLYSGDGGPATAARFDGPYGIVIDPVGRIIVSDLYNNRVRMIDTSGIISTLAGNGLGAYTGDGVLAYTTALYHPSGIALDLLGNLYIADADNNRIRKVLTSGVITTFAGTGVPGFSGDGGNADAAQLQSPAGVVVDGTGNVYIADANNHRVRRVSCPGLPVAGAITGPSTVCEDAIITLSDTSTGTWTSSDTSKATISPTGVVTGVAGGVTTISFTVVNSCGSATVTKTVTVNALPNPGTISGIVNICSATSSTMSTTGTGGVWSTSNPSIVTISSSGVATAASAGIAIISYTAANSCAILHATLSVTVGMTPYAGSITGEDSICTGTFTTTITASGVGGTWSSSNPSIVTVYPIPGGSSTALGGVTSGTATISYIVASTCGTVIATYGITASPGPMAAPIAGPLTVCIGDTVAFTGASSGGFWTSSDTDVVEVGLGTGFAVGISTGVAQLSYTIEPSCGTVIATKIVTVNAAPVIPIISGAASVCEGAATTLTGSISGGTWSTSASSVAVVGSSSGIVTGVSGDTVRVYYTITNLCGPTSTFRIMTVSPLPESAVITGPLEFCNGSTVHLTDTVLGGVWSSSAAGIASVNSAGFVTGFAAGTAVISYNVTNPCGSSIAVVIVSVNPLPSSGAINNMPIKMCSGDSVQLTTTGSPGGIWSVTGGFASSISPTGKFYANSVGTPTISYTVTNFCGTSVALTTVNVLARDCQLVVAEVTAPELVIAPNPSAGTFSISLLSPVTEDISITVYNITGQKMIEVASTTNKSSDVQLDVPGGLYFITVSSPSGKHSAKMVITR
ncbi:MAG: T9SS type A sorting domain-containing protein [Bacteroidota bacterium]